MKHNLMELSLTFLSSSRAAHFLILRLQHVQADLTSGVMILVPPIQADTAVVLVWMAEGNPRGDIVLHRLVADLLPGDFLVLAGWRGMICIDLDQSHDPVPHGVDHPRTHQDLVQDLLRLGDEYHVETILLAGGDETRATAATAALVAGAGAGAGAEVNMSVAGGEGIFTE